MTQQELTDTRSALEYLSDLLAADVEYPDAEYKTATRYHIDAEDLRAEYDRLGARS